MSYVFDENLPRTTIFVPKIAFIPSIFQQFCQIFSEDLEYSVKFVFLGKKFFRALKYSLKKKKIQKY